MKWIREHKLISVLVIIILILSVIFGVSVILKDTQNSATSVVNEGTATVSEFFTNVVTAVKDNIYGLFSYRLLQDEIEELKAENNSLKRQIAQIKLSREQLEELEELSNVLNYDYISKEYNIVTADLISMDGSNWTNVFTINVGAESGVKVGDAVINGIGLVGRIYETGNGWSKVTSIIDEDSKVSFKLSKNRKALGVAYGDSHGEISGYMIDSNALVYEGDIIVTSGLGTYPPGLEIGKVRSVVYNSNTLLKEIVVEPAVNFKSIDKVAVVL